MDKKKLMLLLGAMVVAIGTALAARSMLAGGQAAPVVQAALPIMPKGPRVLVAQRSLPPGTIITADAVTFQEWPGGMVRDAYFVDGKIDMNKLIGTVVRYPVTAGQPMTQGSLVAPGDRGFLAAALGPGMRAVTITVSEKSGVAGFVFPGDHVDILLSSTVKITSSAQAGNLKLNDDRDLHATETILRNLRVLATDQSTESETANGKTIVKNIHTVTLEVSPKIAEKIEVAQAAGSLSLTLRSLADNQADLDRAIATGAVKLPAGATKADEDQALARSAHSPLDSRGASSFVTGSDVSRFERRFNGNTASARQAVTKALTGFAGRAPSDHGVRVTRGKDTQTVSSFGGGIMPAAPQSSADPDSSGLAPRNAAYAH